MNFDLRQTLYRIITNEELFYIFERPDPRLESKTFSATDQSRGFIYTTCVGAPGTSFQRTQQQQKPHLE